MILHLHKSSSMFCWCRGSVLSAAFGATCSVIVRHYWIIAFDVCAAQFDFVMASATSVLTVDVWDTLNWLEGRFSLKGLTGARQDAKCRATCMLE